MPQLATSGFAITGNFGSCLSGTFTNQKWQFPDFQFLEIAIDGDLCEWPDLAIFRSGLSHQLPFLASSFLANIGNFHKLPILASPFVAIFGLAQMCQKWPGNIARVSGWTPPPQPLLKFLDLPLCIKVVKYAYSHK